MLQPFAKKPVPIYLCLLHHRYYCLFLLKENNRYLEVPLSSFTGQLIDYDIVTSEIVKKYEKVIMGSILHWINIMDYHIYCLIFFKLLTKIDSLIIFCNLNWIVCFRNPPAVIYLALQFDGFWNNEPAKAVLIWYMVEAICFWEVRLKYLSSRLFKYRLDGSSRHCTCHLNK